ncbi:hypothetical protein HDU86_007964 [Geranomyces michiganensis]|nr:hypothetical protein HDU86_007964 [Geranomyces michiganensis]
MYRALAVPNGKIFLSSIFFRRADIIGFWLGNSARFATTSSALQLIGSGACKDRPIDATPIEMMVSALNTARSVLAIQCLPSCAIGKTVEAAKSEYLSPWRAENE